MLGKKGPETSPGPRVTDPVCKMTVDLGEARRRGLAVMHEGREYGFSASCRQRFLMDPRKYASA